MSAKDPLLSPESHGAGGTHQIRSGKQDILAEKIDSNPIFGRMLFMDEGQSSDLPKIPQEIPDV